MQKELPIRFFNDKLIGLLEFAKLTEDGRGTSAVSSVWARLCNTGTDIHTLAKQMAPVCECWNCNAAS
jgi:hypothetical protein